MRDRQTDRDTETQTETERDREKKRQTEGGIMRERVRDRQTDRQREEREMFCTREQRIPLIEILPVVSHSRSVTTVTEVRSEQPIL